MQTSRYFVAWSLEERGILLKKLELVGFKSFPEKTTFELSDGITAVVGPNGCGKSNISDAIRWVLGEHRTKPLRGEKMEDFIFSGTQNKKAMNMAEVTLTLDNSQGHLGLDYDEVTIKRKYYRSGDSEYFLNKTPCRLKDIQETFMDTGLGKDTYSIISQGEIDKILSASPYERRYLFEEASGILKHKTRKQEALKRLNDTEHNLSRVSDVIEELNQQLPPLKQQAERASKYKELKDKMMKLEVNLLAHRIDEKRAKWYELDETYKQIENNKEEISSQLRTIESELETIKTQLVDLEKEMEKQQQQNVEVVSEIEQKQGQDKILSERKENLEKEQVRLESEQANIEKEIEKLTTSLTDLDNKYESLKKEKHQVEEDLHNIKNRLDKMSQENNELENAKASLIEVISHRQRKETEYDNYYKEQTRLKKELDELKTEVKKLQSRQEELDNKIKQIKEQQITKQSRLDELVTKITSEKQRIDGLESEKQQLTDRINDLNQRLQGYKSRYEALKEFYNSDSFSRGVREVLKLKENNPQSWSGVIGTVSQLISVEKHYLKAIETALGQAQQNIVTANDAEAKKVLEHLKKYKLGRATCLPLDNLQPRYLNQKQRQIIRECEITGIASQLITISEKYRVVAEHLLGRVIVVPNMDTGLELAKKLKFSLKLVTLDGELILPGGAMVGGSNKKSSSSLQQQLSNDDNKTKLQNQISTTQKELQKLQEDQKQIEEQLQNKRSNIDKLMSERHQLDLELGELRKDQENFATEKAKILEDIEVYQLKQQTKQQELSDLDSNIEETESKLQELDQTRSKLEQDIKELETEFKQTSDEYKKLNEQKLTFEVNVGKLDERLKNISEDRQETYEKTRYYREEKLPQIKEELKELSEKINDTINEKKDNHTKIEELRTKQRELSNTLDNLKQERENTRETLSEKETRQKELAKQEKEIDQQSSQLKMKKSRIETELSNILERLDEQYDMEPQEALNHKEAIDDFKKYEYQIKNIQSEINQLGEVNLGAIEEYNRLQERMDFLKDQQKDLRSAQKSLNKLLSEIDSTMKNSFSETVTKINQTFKRVFTEIYGGGSAHLEYTDESDLLNTGIEIIAKPPGKKKQNLSLLSGGERALTVIALLFSVHEIKPTPFCILDEIDASLDESNLEILTRFMKSYAQNTQFIVITHRKKTMLAANRFYGITMAEPGISQLISVKLEDDDIIETA